MKLILLLLALPAFAQECVPFNDNPSYCRQGVTAWYLAPNTNDWPLFLNGVDQHSPDFGGPASIDWNYATPKKEVKVGICDSSHGISLDYIITNISWCSLYHSSPDAIGIRDCTINGCSIIACPWFTAIQGSPAVDLSNACYEASQAGVILVCSVPNVNQSIDTTPALPASLNIPLLIPVTSSTRQDTVYNPAATGTNVIAAPGRVILTQDINGNPVYASGTSYAAPIVAGVCAWMLSQFNQIPAIVVQAIKAGSVPIDPRIVGRISIRCAVEALRPVMSQSGEAIGPAVYELQYSTNMVDWSVDEPISDQKFVRAKVL